ncbi:MAG: hypothetical protein M5U05_08340 [Anaerolineales bacterium]|nr:hypothetical protein [Anaerolineales bacterium]
MEQPADNQKEPSFYYPSSDLVATAHIQEYEALYRESIRDPQAFWAAQASELEWFQPWEKVLDDSNPPFFKWFVGGVPTSSTTPWIATCTPFGRTNSR